jgi:tetratricopeptide (TPR) repeat protein
MAAATAPVDVSAQALFTEAVARHVAGDAAAATSLYRQALARDPNLAEACSNLATLLAQSGDEREAEDLLQRAVALQPRYGEAHNSLGILRSAHGDHIGALSAFERAVALEGNRPQWLKNLGDEYVEHCRYSDALAAYDRALAIDPGDVECWSVRGFALRGLRRPDEAIMSFQRACTSNAPIQSFRFSPACAGWTRSWLVGHGFLRTMCMPI